MCPAGCQIEGALFFVHKGAMSWWGSYKRKQQLGPEWGHGGQLAPLEISFGNRNDNANLRMKKGQR